MKKILYISHYLLNGNIPQEVLGLVVKNFLKPNSLLNIFWNSMYFSLPEFMVNTSTTWIFIEVCPMAKKEKNIPSLNFQSTQ
jgi:hypothetical protein